VRCLRSMVTVLVVISCKPAVAAILASCWNDFVLKKRARKPAGFERLLPREHPARRHLFRRPADGRRRGHARGLIAVGQVRKKKYGLLHPRSQAGRVSDLFGARVEQLPLKSGRADRGRLRIRHAYGKSVRTVKVMRRFDMVPPRMACGDSVGLRYRIENPLQGLRTPHKIKFGVSGCTRECAEAPRQGHRRDCD